MCVRPCSAEGPCISRHQKEGPAGPCSAECPTADLGGHQRDVASSSLMPPCNHDPEGDEALLC